MAAALQGEGQAGQTSQDEDGQDDSLHSIRLSLMSGNHARQSGWPQIFLTSLPTQVPSSILWLIAWEKSSGRGEELELSPVLIEVSMASRFLYIIIVPLLHGAVEDWRHRADTVPRVTVSHININ